MLVATVAAAGFLSLNSVSALDTARSSLSAAAPMQSNPAIEYQSLLNLRYYEADGGFLVDHLQLIFPPPADQKLSFVIDAKSGEELARVPLRSERLQTFDTFRLMRPDGVPGVVRLSRAGDFVMSVKLGNQSITSVPFTLKEEKSQDAYNPKKTFVREGPWRDLAYFSFPVDRPETQITFNWWMSLRELPTGVTRPLCTVHVMQGGREVAATRSPVVPSGVDWQFFRVQLVEREGPSPQWLTSPSMLRREGELTVVIKVNGQPIKSYRGQIKGGQPLRLARNQLGFEPRADFIATRLIDMSRSCEYCMLDLFWLTRVGR